MKKNGDHSPLYLKRGYSMKNQGKGKLSQRFAMAGLILFAILGAFGPLQAAVLSDAEEEDLVFMREEEKLARDVYLVLFDTWQTPVFSNIATSEQTHMDTLKVLLDRYGIADPAEGKAPGEFANSDLQALYDQLVLDGSQSLTDAMEVGIVIEETDIADLQEALGDATRRDLIRVYTNLMNASYNHLNAFTSQLAR